MDFTKDKTNIVKGTAICWMFIHHLYGFNDRLLNGSSYIPSIPFWNIEQSLASVGSICVSMFLFLSGYGLLLGWVRSQQSPLRYSLAKLKDFYLTYWLYFIVFVPLGFIFFSHTTFWNSSQLRYSGDIVIFLANFLGWSTTYNQEWWFVRVFVIVLLLFPLYIKLSKNKTIWMILTSLSLLLLGLKLKVEPWEPLGFTIWQVSFVLGIVCAKLRFFSSRLIEYFEGLSAGWALLGWVLCFMVGLLLRWRYGFYGVKYDFLIAPFFIYFTVRTVPVLHLSKIFAFLGLYSFPLWLVHSFFCYYYSQKFIYFPKWSPLIFLLLTTLSLGSVLAIEFLRSQLLKVKSSAFRKDGV